MRPSFLLFPAALLLASDAGAQAGNYPVTDGASMSTVQVTAPPRSVRLDSEQIHAVNGYYVMSNGWRMKVRAASRYIDAAIDQERPMRLVAVSPDKFVSNDGAVTMEFNRGPYGDDMLMSYVDPSLAQVVTITSQIAQR